MKFTTGRPSTENTELLQQSRKSGLERLGDEAVPGYHKVLHGHKTNDAQLSPKI